MTLPVITVSLDIYTGAALLTDQTFAYFAPSVPLTYNSSPLYAAPVGVQFQAPPVSVSLASTDNGSITPANWNWTLAFSQDPGFVGGPSTSLNFSLPAGPATFTATNASPAVFTWTPTAALVSLPNGTGIQLSGGSLPAGFAGAPSVYYVVNSSGSTFSLATVPGGTAVNSTSSGSGSLTVVSMYLSALIASSWQ